MAGSNRSSSGRCLSTGSVNQACGPQSPRLRCSPFNHRPRTVAPKSVSDTPDIELRGLVKRFGELVAVAGIDLEVRPGEFLALLGRAAAARPRRCA